MSSATRSLTHDDYTIACICPMGVEQAPVEAILDEIHPSLPLFRDKNSYTLGRMHQHNVVVAIMPDIGNNSAASVANQLMNDFRCLRFALLIGTGGGIPNLEAGFDIRLGDVVVSKPSKNFGGVVQFDRGVDRKAHFQRTGMLGRPPDVLLATVGRLEALHRLVDSSATQYLQDMLQKYPKMRNGGYCHQGSASDNFFQADYHHQTGNNCKDCDIEKGVSRPERSDTSPVIHYGTIGSSNVVVMDSHRRDQLKKDLNIQCVEMEAAGLMESFPCLVIRGICDYADSHKNKMWQPYAAATAAAYAKELLSKVPTLSVAASSQSSINPLPFQNHIVLHMTGTRNLVNGSVTGDIVAGDKFDGRYASSCQAQQNSPYRPTDMTKLEPRN